MSFQEAIKNGFRNYVKFSGRARRSEFWYWTLFTVVVSFIASALDSLLFGGSGTADPSTGISTAPTPIGTIASLALLLPSAAVAFRRLHDTGRSGWWYIGYLILGVIGGVTIGFSFVNAMMSGGSGGGALALGGIVGLVLLVYAIVLLVFYVKDSEPGDNKYGPNPKGVGGMNPAMAAGAYSGHDAGGNAGPGQQDPNNPYGQDPYAPRQ